MVGNIPVKHSKSKLMEEKPTIILSVQGTVNLVLKPMERPCETSAGDAPQQPLPDIRLNVKKISKIDFIRIVYTLCKLGCFVNSMGEVLKPLKVFQALGMLLGMDLSGYQNDLNNSLQLGKNEKKHLNIFQKMMAVMKEKYMNS